MKILDHLIIVHDRETAIRLDFIYRGTPGVRAITPWDTTGLLCRKLIIMPFPDHWTEVERAENQQDIRENAWSRVVPDGEIVHL